MSANAPRTIQNQAVVDADNPWPGLVAFTEDLHAYFYGRAHEADDLFRRIKRKPLTVLFGMSGLGKTSLLQAGVFPRLRHDGFLPIAIRLEYSPDAPALMDQVIAALAQMLASAELASTVTPDKDETLWEFLHRRDLIMKNRQGQPLTPVLVFDQFEEIFTLGDAPAVRASRLPFLTELADLIENRPPAALEQTLEDNPDKPASILFDRQDYRILLSLREDFLPQLEGLKKLAPSIMENRLRLTQMNGRQAMEVLLNPGSALISPEVARQIVAFVARTGSTAATLAVDELEDYEIAPPILSLFARQLNDKRREQGLPQITATLLSASAAGILQSFYEDSLAHQPPAVRAFVEEDLLTESGFRENISLEQARKRLHDRGGPAVALEDLVQRRLLQIEKRFGVQRVELTHDVLTEAIRKSRTERRQHESLAAAERREAELRETVRRQRRRMVVGSMVVMAIVGVISGLAIYAWIEQREATEKQALAVKQKDLAMQAINKLTYDLPNKLEKIPGTKSVVKEVYEENIQLLNKVLELDGNSPDAQREKLVNYNRMGGTWKLLGDTGKAREAHEKATLIGEKLVAQDPKNKQWLDDLALSHKRLGQVIADQGDQIKALKEFRKALNIHQRLATQDPDNSKWQSEMAVNYVWISSALVVQSNLALAREEVQHALEITQRLIAKDAHNADLQNMLAQERAVLANCAMMQGDTITAINELRFKIEITKSMVAMEPGNIEFQKILASDHFNYGNSLHMHGDEESCIREVGMAMEIYKHLIVREPDNTDLQKNLALNHFLIGSALMESDVKKGGLELRSALEILKRLSGKDPSNMELQSYLLHTQLQIAGALNTLEQFSESAAEAREVLTTAERMANQDPKNVLLVQPLIPIAHYLIGFALKEQGKLDQSMKEVIIGIGLLKRLAEQDPSNALLNGLVADNGDMLSEIYVAQKRYKDALQALTTSQEVIKSLINRFPKNQSYKGTLAINYNEVAWVFLHIKRSNEAIGIASKAIELDPQKKSLKRNLAHAYLLANQFDNAKTVYLNNKDVKLPDGRTFTEAVLKDYRDLRKAGINHPDMKKIERLLRTNASQQVRNQ